jgi:hypothetical protein
MLAPGMQESGLILGVFAETDLAVRGRSVW